MDERIMLIIESRIIYGFDKKKLKEEYNITEIEWKEIKSRKKIELHFAQEVFLILKIEKLFKSKIAQDKDIFQWNKDAKNKEKDKKNLVFTEYCIINEDGGIAEEKAKEFYFDVKKLYQKQIKEKLKEHLTWLKKDTSIQEHEKVCNYCGVSEAVLGVLYNDESYTCKTKRKRGAWFELDRKDASTEDNKYTKDNMVLCCYFCNNHKSDVISVSDMRKYFGQPMFKFLMSKYDYIKSKK